MRAPIRLAVVILSVPLVLAPATCDSSHDRVFDPCSGVDECDYEGQILCMTDTRYRECTSDGNGCLVWDCST